MHKKVRSSKSPQVRLPDRTPNLYEERQVTSHWLPVKHRQFDQQERLSHTSNAGVDFPISTWGEELAPPVLSKSSDSVAVIDQWTAEVHGSSPEIGVWNGNALDLSHLKEMPIFSIVVDVSLSEKSTDILTWIQHRYGKLRKGLLKMNVRLWLFSLPDDFAPSSSPLSVSVRFLEVSLHEERKFDSLMLRLPEHLQGLQLAEICERRSALSLASHLPRFTELRFLDFEACAFDLADQPEAVYSLGFALSQLSMLERLSLAHNCITGCLADLLSPLQHGLKMLDLSSCYLNDDDLAYLGESFHRPTLRSLSLASNELGTHWNRLQTLVVQLGGYGSSLRILDLSSNEFVESQMAFLCRTMLGPLASLALLDLSWHELPLASVTDIVELLASKTNLRTFCLSTPTDMDECGYGQADSWQSFVDFFRALTTKHREGAYPAKSPLTLHWCLM